MSETTGPDAPLPPAIQLDEPSRVEPPIVPPIWEPPPAPVPSLRPVPFEDPETFPTFWSRVGGMFRMVFSHPLELFDRVPVNEGLGAPWRFLLLLSIPVFLIVALLFFFLGLGIMMTALEESGRGESKTLVAVMPLIFGAILLLMPLFSFLGMVIGGAFNHFFLWMWGGLRPGAGTQQSIRAYGYASAFIQIGGLIPYIGILIHLAGMVAIGMGLARMHKTDTWRGICAVLTPVFLACCCLVPLFIMGITYFQSLSHHH
ncbi:MAG TPA: YIP1 family protein [Geothrix sp.]|nr:YIP1 family protein [Geothrix sp.]